MSAGQAILRFITALDAGVVAGSLVAVHFAVLPAMLHMPAGAAVLLHQTFDRFIHRYMPVMTFSASIVAIVLLAGWPDEGTGTLVLTATGLAGTVLTILISQFRNVPINRIVLSWPPGEPGPDYEDMRARWGRYDLIRTVCAVFAAASFIVAAILAAA